MLGAARGGAIVPAVITNLERKERDASLDLARLYARPDVGRFEDAHAVLDALERRHPDDRDVLESRCRVFLAQGRVDDAEKLRAKLDR